jgi:hypothetical protein
MASLDDVEFNTHAMRAMEEFSRMVGADSAPGGGQDSAYEDFVESVLSQLTDEAKVLQGRVAYDIGTAESKPWDPQTHKLLTQEQLIERGIVDCSGFVLYLLETALNEQAPGDASMEFPRGGSWWLQQGDVNVEGESHPVAAVGPVYAENEPLPWNSLAPGSIIQLHPERAASNDSYAHNVVYLGLHPTTRKPMIAESSYNEGTIIVREFPEAYEAMPKMMINYLTPAMAERLGVAVTNKDRDRYPDGIPTKANRWWACKRTPISPGNSLRSLNRGVRVNNQACPDACPGIQALSGSSAPKQRW